MGVAAWLCAVCLALIAAAVCAFSRRKRGIGLALLALLTFGAVMLAYLWINSPM